jgi:hypothetical protein
MEHQPSVPQPENAGAEHEQEIALREANKRLRQGNQHFAAVLRREMKEIELVWH